MTVSQVRRQPGSPTPLPAVEYDGCGSPLLRPYSLRLGMQVAAWDALAHASGFQAGMQVAAWDALAHASGFQGGLPTGFERTKRSASPETSLKTDEAVRGHALRILVGE